MEKVKWNSINKNKTIEKWQIFNPPLKTEINFETFTTIKNNQGVLGGEKMKRNMKIKNKQDKNYQNI